VTAGVLPPKLFVLSGDVINALSPSTPELSTAFAEESVTDKL
jgi:hypothetical protein